MEAPRTNLRPSGRFQWIIPAAAVLAAGAYVAIQYANRKGISPPTTATVAPSPTPAVTEPSPGAAESQANASEVTEAPVDASGAASLLERIPANALFRKWLAEGDVVHRWVMVTDNVAEGATPRKVLGLLAPHAPFSVARRGERLVIAPESYARYDAIADAIDSVDVRALAMAYRRLHAVLEAANHALGFPAGSLDRLTSRALRRIENAPVAEDDVYVENQEGLYAFTDPHLEELGAIEKDLLRMGPRNERLVKAKARQLLEALNLPAVASRPNR